METHSGLIGRTLVEYLYSAFSAAPPGFRCFSTLRRKAAQGTFPLTRLLNKIVSHEFLRDVARKKPKLLSTQ